MGWQAHLNRPLNNAPPASFPDRSTLSFSVMRKVPNGSAVVFVLGEIDCREGILVAVEKLRYETPEEGAEHTIGIFIEVCTCLSTALCLL